MSQQVGIAYELYAIAAAVLGGCSLRGGEGTVLGIDHRLVRSCASSTTASTCSSGRTATPDGIRRIWRLDNNWKFIIIGAVILVAVMLDQVVHMRPVEAADAAGGAGRGPSPPP